MMPHLARCGIIVPCDVSQGAGSQLHLSVLGFLTSQPSLFDMAFLCAQQPRLPGNGLWVKDSARLGAPFALEPPCRRYG